jgi:small subunit ribosomal protein S2
MPVVSMKELLEAGVHFGHQTRRWNPKMKRFIFTERGGIYIIDLQQTQRLLDDAYDFVRAVAERNGSVLFVGTKKQAQDSVAQEATRVGMPYVNHRWLGGLLTNWRTMADRIQRLHELRALRDESQLDLLPAKERIAMLAELDKLEANLGGVADMRRQPDAVFIVDLRKEQLAVREARRLGLPVIALVDTNCDPDEADYVIPGNDDAIRSCSLVIRAVADGIEAGRQRVTVAEAAAPRARADGGRQAPSEAQAGASEEPAAADIPVASEAEAASAGKASEADVPASEPAAAAAGPAEAPVTEVPAADAPAAEAQAAVIEPAAVESAVVEAAAPEAAEAVADAATEPEPAEAEPAEPATEEGPPAGAAAPGGAEGVAAGEAEAAGEESA